MQGERTEMERKMNDLAFLKEQISTIKSDQAIARRMDCEWGMSDTLGMVEYGENNEHVFLARDMGSKRNYSESTAQKIDSEIKRLIDNAYQRAKELLLEHRSEMETLAKALLEYETLDGVHVKEIMEHGQMLNPPRSKPPTPPAVPAESTREADEELPPGLAGAPA